MTRVHLTSSVTIAESTMAKMLVLSAEAWLLEDVVADLARRVHCCLKDFDRQLGDQQVDDDELACAVFEVGGPRDLFDAANSLASHLCAAVGGCPSGRPNWWNS